ncbi:MAG: DNA (cytosine-5-)-methyltransferase [Patescibacteria group bacterium]|nr:DNA (cytosine-5-)-methyltransferase [Patescibacteria group bacterium]
MRHIDLFSGIGGFALAVEEVWPDSEHIFCDNDSYCQQLIKLRFPNSKIYGDIKKIKSITNADWLGPQEQRKKQQTSRDRQLLKVDILTGGFPCQPFSQAGKRRGTNDARYLWPEMLRIIRLTHPRWVIAENVRGFLAMQNGLVFEQVCTDLEDSGYEVQPLVIPAVAVNAPHRRDRVWFIASNAKSERSRGGTSEECGIKKWSMEQDESKGREIRSKGERRTGRIAYATSGESGKQAKQKRRKDFERGSWERNWLEVAAELCGMDDGLPAKLDGFELSKSRHRIERLKALGNAIVLQVAVEIMKAIKVSEKNISHTRNIRN